MRAKLFTLGYGRVAKTEVSVGEIRVHEFMSLDGVISAPTWSFEYGFDPRMGQAIGTSMEGCHTILLGRTTYEMFEPAWSVRTIDDDPGAPFFNDSLKYVVSSTLTTTSWRNSALFGPYGAQAVQALKESVEGAIYVSGSGTLVRALLADGLVDELHVFLYPLVIGDGPRLHVDGELAARWSLISNESYENGVVYLAHRKVV